MKRLIVLLAGAFALAAQAGAASTVDVVLGSNTAKLTAVSGGSHTAEITLTNVSSLGQSVDPKAPGNCIVTPQTIAVPAGYTTSVTLNFPASCDTKEGSAISLVVQAPSKQRPLALSLQPAAASARWGHVAESFLIAFGVAAVLMLLVGWQFWRTHPLDAEQKGKRNPPRTPLGQELRGLDTGWSFKENWVGNVTVGAAALVALFSSGALGDVVGSGSKATLAAMVVAAAIGTVFVAVGPLILKLFGPDPDVPTVWGTLTAALMTMGGAVGQITALTWLASDIATGGLRRGAIAIGAFVGLVTLAYMVRTLWTLITTRLHRKRQKRSEALIAADEISDAILALRLAQTAGSQETLAGVEEVRSLLRDRKHYRSQLTSAGEQGTRTALL